MPIYEYEAANNGCPYCVHGFEFFLYQREEEPATCPKCNSPVIRVVSRPGRVEVAYTPSDAFKHYVKKLDEQRCRNDKKDGDEKGASSE